MQSIMIIESHASHKEKKFKKKKKNTPIILFHHSALDEEVINLQF